MPSQLTRSSPTASLQGNQEAPHSPWAEQLVNRVNAIAGNAQAKNDVHEEGQHQANMHQLDPFVANLLGYKLKDDTATMEAPLFSLSTKPDMDTWRWISPDKKKWLEVTPSSIGRATIHDKDLLIYLTSQVMAAMNDAARCNAKMPGRRIRFTLHDFLIATGRDTAGKSYASVESTIDRLSGITHKTSGYHTFKVRDITHGYKIKTDVNQYLTKITHNQKKPANYFILYNSSFRPPTRPKIRRISPDEGRLLTTMLN